MRNMRINPGHAAKQREKTTKSSRDLWFIRTPHGLHAGGLSRNDGNHENDEDNSDSYKQGVVKSQKNRNSTCLLYFTPSFSGWRETLFLTYFNSFGFLALWHETGNATQTTGLIRVLSATLILSKNSRVLHAKSRLKSANLS